MKYISKVFYFFYGFGRFGRVTKKLAMPTPTTWDSNQWDTFVWDAVVADNTNKKMNAKIALNIKGLNPREQLTKFEKAVTACGTAPVLPNPNPPLATCKAGNDAIKTNLDAIDTAEGVLVQLRNTRDQLLATGLTNYTALGASVQSFSLGDPAVIIAKGYDVAATPGTLPPVGRPQNLVLTHGDHDGAVDVAWNRDPSSHTNEVHVSPEPMTPTSFVPNQITNKSSCTILGQPAGSKIWVRVRGNDSDGPGDWSAPASIIVS